jgi:hypothetical protein
MSELNYLEKRFIKDETFVSRKIGDTFIVVPIKRKASEIESIYKLDEVSSRIWELVDGEKRVEEIRDTIVDEFEVGQEEAGTDLVELLQQLESIGAVKEI